MVVEGEGPVVVKPAITQRLPDDKQTAQKLGCKRYKPGRTYFCGCVGRWVRRWKNGDAGSCIRQYLIAAACLSLHHHVTTQLRHKLAPLVLPFHAYLVSSHTCECMVCIRMQGSGCCAEGDRAVVAALKATGRWAQESC